MRIHLGAARGCDRAKVGAVELEGNVFFFGGFEQGKEDVQHSESASELSFSDAAWTVLPPVPIWGHFCAFQVDDISPIPAA